MHPICSHFAVCAWSVGRAAGLVTGCFEEAPSVLAFHGQPGEFGEGAAVQAVLL